MFVDSLAASLRQSETQALIVRKPFSSRFYLAWLMLGITALANRATPCLGAEPVEINIYPTIKRQIDGIGQLDRTAFFALCDHGTNFAQRIRTPQRMNYLLKDLGATFGRSLSPLRYISQNSKIVKEDPRRPGFVDLKHLEAECKRRQKKPNRTFARTVGGRLHIAAHGGKNDFPDFMGKFTTPQSNKNPKRPHYIPDNIAAAAELSAAVMQYNYTKFDRPRFYEPLNEPHWSFISNQKLADWHTLTHKAVHDRKLNLQVGGPCYSIAYFYRNNYKSFNGLKDFISNTKCNLDFYSFHVYDFLDWNGEKYIGRVTSGLPLEGVLDLVQSYTVGKFGKLKPIVISEHGGYTLGSNGRPNAEKLADILAAKYFPGGQGFEYAMRKRSIESHVIVSSAIANTLVFLDNPHVVKKAVPFLLPETMGWDPKYSNALYIAHNFTDKNRWVESRNTDFYKFFRDLAGERVIVTGGDPDLQIRAFANKKQLMLVINNTSDTPHTLKLKFPKPQKINLRRYGRSADYTPYLNEEALDSLDTLEMAGREAALLTATYSKSIPTKSTINEVPYYANTITVQPTPKKPARFIVAVPEVEKLAYAKLRIGVTRPHGANPNLKLKVNGKLVEVPLEDAAARLDDGEKEYASTKLIDLDRSLVRKKNRIEIAFPDKDGGTIGSVVLRAGIKQGS